MKCVHCHCHFEPTPEETRMLHEAGIVDIPFCSEACALASTMASSVTDKGKVNRLAYHDGEREDAPTFGVFVERTVNATRHGDGGKDKLITIRVNVGGGVVIRPMTDNERAWAAHLRGRHAFSDNCTVCVLPNAAKYANVRRAHGPFDYPHDRKGGEM